MTVKLLTEHHLEFLSLKGGCTGSYESILFKMPQCWKSHGTALTIEYVVFLCISTRHHWGNDVEEHQDKKAHEILVLIEYMYVQKQG